MKIYKSFDDWWEEFIGVYSNDPQQPKTRGESLMEDYGDDVKSWMQTAWAFGQIQAENTADGHSAEAAKDCRKAGYNDAANHIENHSIHEGRKIIEANIRQIADEAGII